MCIGVNCIVCFNLPLGNCACCAMTGVNRGCYENELECPFKADPASLDVACRLTFKVCF